MLLDNGFEIRDKHDLIDMLWQDYKEKYEAGNPSDSCIYGFLKKDNDRKAAVLAATDDLESVSAKRINLYQMIRAISIAYREERISAGAALILLQKTMDSDKKAGKQVKGLSEEIVRCDSKEQKSILAERLFSGENAILASYLEKLLERLVTNYFNPYGYSVNSLKEKAPAKAEDTLGTAYEAEEKERAQREIERKYQDTEKEGYKDDIRLLNEYISHIGSDAIGSGNAADAALLDDPYYQEKCTRLFRKLKEMENKDVVKSVFIPLGFHPGTGCGVFILGTEVLPEEKEQADCSFAVIAYQYREMMDGELQYFMTTVRFADIHSAVKYMHDSRSEQYDNYYDSCTENAGKTMYLLEQLPEELRGFIDHTSYGRYTEADRKAIEKYKEKKDALSDTKAAVAVSQKQAAAKGRRKLLQK